MMKAYPFLETGFRRKMKKNVNEDQIALVTIPPVIVLKNVEIEHILHSHSSTPILTSIPPILDRK